MSDMKIDAQITRTLNQFHDALVERGQIAPIPTNRFATENATNRYRAAASRQSSHSQQFDEH